MKNYKPAIIVVAYNRADSLKRLLCSIGNAKYPDNDIVLLISIDYHDNNGNVLEVAKSFEWKYGRKIIKTHSAKLGLKEHVLECGDYSYKYDCIIMLEDDLYVSDDFYSYSVEAQKKYCHDDRIAGIALYCNEWNNYSKNNFRPLKNIYSSYFRQTCESWGQSWTKKQWHSFRLWLDDNKIIKNYDNMPNEVREWPDTSWGKYFNSYVVDNNLFLSVPYNARSTCFSEVGINTKTKDVSNQVSLHFGLDSNYHFPSFEEGVHYDLFFENIDLKNHFIELTNGENCCIDIYGLHEKITDRFVLSSKKMNYRIIKRYGLEMRPLEQNILCNIEGDGIYLYDTNYPTKNKNNGVRPLDNYDLSGYPSKRLLIYILVRIREKILRILKTLSNNG